MTGVLDIPATDYHADNVSDGPTLSASVAKLIIGKSPAHAFVAHPRLNPAYRNEDDKFSIGTVAHAILLEGKAPLDVVELCEFDSWRSNAAKEQAASARAAGRVPLLGKHYDDVCAMVSAAREQLARHAADPAPFTNGKAEQTIVWEDQGVKCRARLDWLHDDGSAVDDYKTTTRSAEPASWVRSSLFALGFDIQAAFYTRGIAAVFGAAVAGMMDWRWVVQECSPPYALSVITPGPDVFALANEKVDRALRVWGHCLETGDWPGYEPRVATAELPAWEESRWMEKTGLIEEAA